MSCYNYSNEYKKRINTFLNDLNTLMRESKITIDFNEGSLYFDYKYVGLLEDQDTTLLLEDEESLLHYESDEFIFSKD
jgi:hypothetical protein